MSSDLASPVAVRPPPPNPAFIALYNTFAAGPPVEDMPELKTHNALLGDRAALEEAWEKDGYWFFRDVLDKTGLGNNPVFIKGLYGMVKDLGEGKHVAGKGPTEPGTKAPGSPQTAAQRMYPDLPSASAR